jgi:hypothetical protein
MLIGSSVISGCDADHSSSSSAEVKNKEELYLLSPQAPPWRVVGQLRWTYFTLFQWFMLFSP